MCVEKSVVVEDLVVIHPDVGHPQAVLGQYVFVRAPAVRRRVAEHVANVRARDDLHTAATHPGLRKRGQVTNVMGQTDHGAILKHI